ncbi:MAG: GAF domain-containing protein, partial [Campylobacteraceae bacterium]|nr:GAF domain-containing protein [Campylobacteraceae bacterium]
MWIDSKFLIQISHVLDKLNKGAEVDIDNIASEFSSPKYHDILTLLIKLQKRQKRQNTFMGTISFKIKQLSKGIFYEEEEGEEGVSKLFSKLTRTLLSITRDSSRVNKAASEGILDIRINEKLYLGDFCKMAIGINESIDGTVKTLRDVSDSLKRFSSGDFKAQIKSQYEGDYKRLHLAVNSLGDSLNSLIEDSHKMSEAAKEGNLNARINLNKYKGDFTNIVKSINDTMNKNERDQWIQSGIVGLNEILLGDNDIVDTSSKAISYLAYYLNAGVGALYVYDSTEELMILNASYAYVEREELSNKFKLGEGTVGQVALQKTPIHLTNITKSQRTIDTGTSSEAPLNTYTYPLLYKDKVYGVVELGSNIFFDSKTLEFFEATNTIIATALYSAIANKKVKVLLSESRIQNENIQKTNVEMEEQQQQLEEVNSQMAEQQQQLEEANSQMQEQQQQLKESNAQMEEQQVQLKEKNLTLEQSKIDLDKRAEDLALSSKYKSEFLANMSHELRTPLNSIILLSEMIEEDKFGHLDKEEIKKASIINSSGNDLLRLINDVLDLSKVEAGMLEVIVDEFDSSTFLDEIFVQFEHQAKEKNLQLNIKDSYKAKIKSDKHRLSQILRNLISNSLKFTKEGSISIEINPFEED